MFHSLCRRTLPVTLLCLATPLLGRGAAAQTWNSDGAEVELPAGAAEVTLLPDPAAQRRYTLERLDAVDWTGWEDLSGLLQDVHTRTGIPAIGAALVQDGKLVTHATVGVQAFGSERPVGPADVFHLGSVTKSFTALVVGKLVEQGTLAWNTQVAEILADAPMRDEYRAVTVEQLLQHRSGLPSYTDGWPAEDDPTAVYSGSPVEQREAFLAHALMQPPEGVAGSSVLYSNAGYALVGHMAERASGVSWEQLVQRHVFDVLEMGSAGFGFPEEPLGHAGDGPEFIPVPLDAYPRMQIIAPAGNIHASASDMGRYAIAHLAGLAGRDGVLRSETVQRLHTVAPMDAATPGTPQMGYASGWVIARGPRGEPVHWHAGTVGASYAEVKLYPATDRAVVVLTTVDQGLGEALAHQIARALLTRHRPPVSGFVSAGEGGVGQEITFTKEDSTEEQDARFWRVIRGLSRAINDEDRKAYHALFAPTYNMRDGDSMFDFMARSVLPSRGGVRSFHAPSQPFRVGDAERPVRTVIFHLENGFPGYYGVTLDDEGLILEFSLFVKGDMCPNGTDRNCELSLQALEDLR